MRSPHLIRSSRLNFGVVEGRQTLLKEHFERSEDEPDVRRSLPIGVSNPEENLHKGLDVAAYL